jgi:hypothetical protein
VRLAFLLASVFVAASAHAATPSRAVSVPGAVAALAVDGRVVAYAAGASGRDCDRVRLWNVATGRVTRLGRRTACEQTSTGSGVAQLAVAGNRALWLHYTGGNIREWSLWTATTARAAPRRLAFVSQDVDSPAPIVLGDGDGNRYGRLLPYAVGRRVIALAPTGRRRFTWEAPARVVGLSTVGGNVAVAQEGGRVTILEHHGWVVAQQSYESEIDAVRLAFGAITVQRGRTLERRAEGRHTWRLPAGARLADATAEHAFYVVRGRIHALAFATGRARVVATAEHVAADGPTIAVASGPRVRLVSLARAG